VQLAVGLTDSTAIEIMLKWANLLVGILLLQAVMQLETYCFLEWMAWAPWQLDEDTVLILNSHALSIDWW
jgi:hypothetical protein